MKAVIEAPKEFIGEEGEESRINEKKERRRSPAIGSLNPQESKLWGERGD